MAKKTQKAYLNFAGKSYPVEISIFGQTISAKPAKEDLEQLKSYINTGKARAATSEDRKRARDTYRGKAATNEETIYEMAMADLEGIDLSKSGSAIAKRYIKNYKSMDNRPFNSQALSAMKRTLKKAGVEEAKIKEAMGTASEMVEKGTTTKKKSSKKTPNTEAVKKAAKAASEVGAKFSDVAEEILQRSGVLEERNCGDKKKKMYSKKTDGFKCKYCAQEFDTKAERDKHEKACAA